MDDHGEEKAVEMKKKISIRENNQSALITSERKTNYTKRTPKKCIEYSIFRCGEKMNE